MASSATGLFAAVEERAQWWSCKERLLPARNRAVAHLFIPVRVLRDKAAATHRITQWQCSKTQAKLRWKLTEQLKPLILPSGHTGSLWEWAVSTELNSVLERVLNWIQAENQFELIFLISDHTETFILMIFLQLSQNEQTLILLLQNNRSKFDIVTRDLPAWEQLAPSRAWTSHLLPFKSFYISPRMLYLPRCALWCCFALQTFTAGCSPEQLFHLPKAILLTREIGQFSLLPYAKWPGRLQDHLCICFSQPKFLQTSLGAH